MNGIKHSPGPWSYRDNQDVNGKATKHGFEIVYKDEWIVAHCFYQGCDGEILSIEKAEANARLISEAPSMFKFLTDLVEYVNECEELKQIETMQAQSIVEEAQVIITKIERSAHD